MCIIIYNILYEFIRNNNDKRHNHNISRTDHVCKIKWEEIEFHRKAMVSKHNETFQYIWDLRNYVRQEEKRSLQGVQVINNLQSNLETSAVTSYKAVVGNRVYIYRED